jgi:two-component system, chemotaxis family, sensor kinase CheA
MDDLIKEFLVESNENLDRLDSELVKLETDPSSQELLSSIFRTIHTIKGSCGFLGFSKLEKVAHVGESLLSRLRDGKLSLTPEFTSGLLAMVDAIRVMLGKILSTEQDGTEDYPDLIETLNSLQNQGQEPSLQAAADPLLIRDPSKKRSGDSPQENSAKSIPPASVATRAEQASPVQPESS